MEKIMINKNLNLDNEAKRKTYQHTLEQEAFRRGLGKREDHTQKLHEIFKTTILTYRKNCKSRIRDDEIAEALHKTREICMRGLLR